MPKAPHERRAAARPAPLLVGLAAMAALTGALAASPALGQDWGGGWNGPGGSRAWRADRWDEATADPTFPGDDPREGQVTVERFPAPDSAGLLGHGTIRVAAQAGDDARGEAPPVVESPGPSPEFGPGGISPREEAVFEAAVVDRLAKAGYNTAVPATFSANGPAVAGRQLAELRVTHDLLVPGEQRHSPVSGEVAMGASNHSSMLGLGIAIDLSKPRAGLMSTTLFLRIRDGATGRPLWEGRASIATREDSAHWTDQAIAARLAAALFEGFAANASGAARR